MKPFRSRSMAVYIAAMIRRMTGDFAEVVLWHSERDQPYWRVIRTDYSGNEYEV